MNSYDDADPSNPVPVYLHSPSHKSVKVNLPFEISMQEIKKVAE
jgi:hypothetical protein